MTVAVIDSSVLVSAVLTPEGPAFEILKALEDRLFVAIYTHQIIQEVREALSRTTLRAKYGYTDIQVHAVVRLLHLPGRRVTVTNAPRCTPDPEDDYLVAAAQAVRHGSGEMGSYGKDVARSNPRRSANRFFACPAWVPCASVAGETQDPVTPLTTPFLRSTASRPSDCNHHG